VDPYAGRSPTSRTAAPARSQESTPDRTRPGHPARRDDGSARQRSSAKRGPRTSTWLKRGPNRPRSGVIADLNPRESMAGLQPPSRCPKRSDVARDPRYRGTPEALDDSAGYAADAIRTFGLLTMTTRSSRKKREGFCGNSTCVLRTGKKRSPGFLHPTHTTHSASICSVRSGPAARSSPPSPRARSVGVVAPRARNNDGVSESVDRGRVIHAGERLRELSSATQPEQASLSLRQQVEQRESADEIIQTLG